MEYALNDVTTEGCAVIESHSESHLVVGEKDIRIDSDLYQSIMQDNEIKLAVEKRFKGKRTMYGDPGFGQIVAWCLSTDSYKVSERNISMVSDPDVDQAWQFIDTMSVSSTKRCRDLISKCKGARSSVGFRRENFAPRINNAARNPIMGGVPPPTLATYTKEDSDGYSHLSEVIAADCMEWIRASDDPVGLMLELLSGVSKGNEGRYYAAKHLG